MTAYDASEMLAAAEEQRMIDQSEAIEQEEMELHEVCEEYAITALEDGTNWAELLEAYHDTTDPSDWPVMYDQLRILAIREPGTDEYNYTKRELVYTLARAVDRGCLLED